MAHFDVFYFDNRIDSAHPLDPHRVLTPEADGILQMVSEWPMGEDVLLCCDERRVQALVDIGVLRWEDNDLRFDTPIFLQEDAAALTGLFANEAERLAVLLNAHREELRAIACRIDNGFDEAVNLYHIICGMVLDGAFFAELCEADVVATSRKHSSGMDYLTIIYQKCEALDYLSRRLLCSWNRLIGDGCALQSFGDADGSRHDFYRAYRLQALSRSNGQFPECSLLPPQEKLIAETWRLLQCGDCDPTVLRLLERYDYARNGRICVPVFRAADKAVVDEIAALVARVLMQPVKELLLHCDLDITAVQHGVNRRELANELYHILFGQINESLVKLGTVALPLQLPGEGRYLKSIQLF